MRIIPLLSLLLLPAATIAPAATPAPKSCLSTSSASDGSLIPLDDSHVLIRSGARRYVGSFMGGRCPSLRDDSILIVEQFSGQLCRGDRVRPIQRGQSIAGPICVLDRFEPYVEPKRRR